jgi:hypothetical protein
MRGLPGMPAPGSPGMPVGMPMPRPQAGQPEVRRHQTVAGRQNPKQAAIVRRVEPGTRRRSGVITKTRSRTVMGQPAEGTTRGGAITRRRSTDGAAPQNVPAIASTPAQQIADLTVVLVTQHHPRMLALQIAALTASTVGPREIIIVEGGERNAENAPVLDHFKTVKLGRALHWSDPFMAAANAEGAVVCVLEETTVPGARWLESAIGMFGQLEQPALIVAAGETLRPDGSIERIVGPMTPPDDHEPVDVGRGGWVFPKFLAPALLDGVTPEDDATWRFGLSARASLLEEDGEDAGWPTVVLAYGRTSNETWGSTMSVPRPEPVATLAAWREHGFLTIGEQAAQDDAESAAASAQ